MGESLTKTKMKKMNGRITHHYPNEKKSMGESLTITPMQKIYGQIAHRNPNEKNQWENHSP